MAPLRILIARLCVFLAAQVALADESTLPVPPRRRPSLPLTPAQAQKEFRLPPGLRLELVASEPVVQSPVAMAFDAQGRLWVVEMRDYPNGPPRGQPPEGRIRILEDRDGDGYFETGSTFADGLLFANGLLPWRDGVIVTAAPFIAWLRDTDGDGKADKREVLYEGFAAQNPQLRVSHPNLGLDGWITVANGLRGGDVRRAGRDDAPIKLGGLDFRFDLIHDKGESVSGMGQFGNTFDAWGRRFVCDNRHHLRHVVLEDRYVRRNPFLAVPELVEDVSELDGGPLNSGGKVYPLSRNWTTSSLHEGRFTAACGVFAYDGALLGKDFQGALFTCEPTGNLVHMERLQPHGATFQSKPYRQGVEFLATPDDWFRPVFMTTGPDDALYVVDMYRAVIEHPDFMPPELKQRPDLLLGKDRGRIWRIVPEKGTAKRPAPALQRATVAELVAALERPEPWWRRTAQRLLLERQDPGAVEPLRALLKSTKQPHARMQAAWLLDGAGKLTARAVEGLLRDPEPRVREQAVILAEKHLDIDDVRGLLLGLADDADARVRFQTALTLGALPGQEIIAALVRIARAGGDDRWTRYAVATAVPRQAGELFAASLKTTASDVVLLRELAALVGAGRDEAEIAGVVAALRSRAGDDAFRLQLAGLNGLADGLGRRGDQLGTLLPKLPPGDGSAQRWFLDFLAKSAPQVRDGRLPVEQRLLIVRLLGHGPWAIAKKSLQPLVAGEPSLEIRLAAVRSLAAHSDKETAPLLMQSWRSAAPAVRRELLEAMLRQPDRVVLLLSEVEAKNVRPGEIDPARTQQLLKHASADIRDRARRLLHESLPKDRQAVLGKYRESLALKADALKGREVFRKTCATCHRVGGIGIDVGPDVADTRTRTLDALLTDILLPNQAIDNNYVNYLVTARNGQVYSGLLSAENASSVTLKRAEGQTDVILRQDVDDIVSTGVSLMPEGLEQTIGLQEMADLLSFLKNWRYLDGATPVAP